MFPVTASEVTVGDVIAVETFEDRANFGGFAAAIGAMGQLVQADFGTPTTSAQDIAEALAATMGGFEAALNTLAQLCQGNADGLTRSSRAIQEERQRLTQVLETMFATEEQNAIVTK